MIPGITVELMFYNRNDHNCFVALHVQFCKEFVDLICMWNFSVKTELSYIYFYGYYKHYGDQYELTVTFAFLLLNIILLKQTNK